MPHVLALDQSTSATKALLFGADGRLLDRESRDHRQHYPQPGWVEHDAEEIWQNTLAVLRTLAARQEARLRDTVCLSLTNQRETVVVFERGTGRPLHRAMVWQCRRGDAVCAELRARGHEGLVRRRTGLKIDTYFSASKLKWLVAAEPAIARKLRDGGALIGTMDTYLLYRLTGGRVFAADSTNASRTLLFDIGRLRWDEELCALFDVPLAALPEVRESSARFGETDALGALPAALPICGVMGDSQAALFAQRCFQPGTAKATFGTGTSVLLNIGERFRVSERGAVTALAWVWRGRPVYAFEGIINFSAATIEWLKNQLGLIQSASEVEALATAVPDNGGVYLVPAFAGLSAPYWAPDARAAILGMTAHTRREHIVRAALESIAYQVRDVLDAMRAEAGVPLQGLRADGGAVANRFLMQFTADLTGTELRVSGVPEASPLGAAAAGLLGMGACGSPEETVAAAAHGETVYRPSMPAAEAQRLYAGWQRAIRQVLA
jgi:glycerol kinase